MSKTKTLILQLHGYIFVFVHAKCRFSHDAGYIKVFEKL